VIPRRDEGAKLILPRSLKGRIPLGRSGMRRQMNIRNRGVTTMERSDMDGRVAIARRAQPDGWIKSTDYRPEL
jgi:hypothetical protein